MSWQISSEALFQGVERGRGHGALFEASFTADPIPTSVVKPGIAPPGFLAALKQLWLLDLEAGDVGLQKKNVARRSIEMEKGGSGALFAAPGFAHFVSRHAEVLQELVKAWKDENNQGQHSPSRSSRWLSRTAA